VAAIFDDQRFGYWRCDECGRTLSAVASSSPPQLPDPWREVTLDEFVGAFHVCGHACAVLLRAELKRRLR